jgi:acyl carrier protein
LIFQKEFLQKFIKFFKNTLTIKMNSKQIEQICVDEIKQFFKDVHGLDSVKIADIFNYINKKSDDEFAEFIVDLRAKGRYCITGENIGQMEKIIEKARQFAGVARAVMTMLKMKNKNRWNRVDTKVIDLEMQGNGMTTTVNGISIKFM